MTLGFSDVPKRRATAMKPEHVPDQSKGRMKEAPAGPGENRALSMEESELVSRCRDGDASAYGILVTRYRDRAYGLALRLTRSAPDAEEVAQDALVSAWRAIGAFRGDAAFGTWLYRIVYRKALDRAASLRIRGGREVAVDDPARLESLDGVAEAGPGGHETDAGNVAERLETLIADLPEIARAVVTMFYYEDVSVKDIGVALDLPEGTVKTHLHRARAAIRQGWLQTFGSKHDDAV